VHGGPAREPALSELIEPGHRSTLATYLTPPFSRTRRSGLGASGFASWSQRTPRWSCCTGTSAGVILDRQGGGGRGTTVIEAFAGRSPASLAAPGRRLVGDAPTWGPPSTGCRAWRP